MKNIRKRLSLLIILLVSFFLFGAVNSASAASNVTELSPSGAKIGAYYAGNSPQAIAIGKSGNVWVANDGNGTTGTASGDSNVTELSSDGKTIGTFVAGPTPWAIAIDGNNNVWVANNNDPGTVTELNSRGRKIGVFSEGLIQIALQLTKTAIRL